MLLRILLLILFTCAPAAAFAEKRVALVIGNSAYKHTKKLPNPRRDAVEVGRQLKNLGFTVIPGGLDLNKAAMDQAVRAFTEALAGADVALLFYAGHGMQVSGENYLIPLDAKLSTPASLEFETVRLNFILRLMQSEAKTSIVFLDACRDNPLSRSFSRTSASRSLNVGIGLAPVEAGSGTIISFSTEPGKVASDGDGDHSPFAQALIRELSNPVDDLSAMLVNVRNGVMLDTDNQQVPWEHSALRSKFYFHDTSNLSDAQALAMCVTFRRNPGAQEIVQRLAKSLQSKSYEYGWAGGSANAGDINKSTAYKVTSVTTERDELHLSYTWEHGKVALVPVVMMGGSRAPPKPDQAKKGLEIVGATMQGFWRQDNGIGCVLLSMDDTKAKGAWSDQIGKWPDKESFLRPAQR